MNKILHYTNLAPAELYNDEVYKREIPLKVRNALGLHLPYWQQSEYDKIFIKSVMALKPDNKNNILNTHNGRTYWDDVIQQQKNRRLFGKAMQSLFIENNIEQSFNIFKDSLNLPFAVSAYIFFVYNDKKYMPVRISMNHALEELGYPTLNRNYDLDNYLIFLNTLQYITKKLGSKKTLIDAHDFVWIVRRILHAIESIT